MLPTNWTEDVIRGAAHDMAWLKLERVPDAEIVTILQGRISEVFQKAGENCMVYLVQLCKQYCNRDTPAAMMHMVLRMAAERVNNLCVDVSSFNRGGSLYTLIQSSSIEVKTDETAQIPLTRESRQLT